MSSSFDDIKNFLPKYLSDSDTKKLFSELKDFPKNLDSRIYSNYLLEEDNIIFQGDCIKGMSIANFKTEKFSKSPCIIFSNTCDIDLSNKRVYSSNIVYAPLFDFEKYQETLKQKKDDEFIKNHVEDIKNQRITQILYLPKGGKLPKDCIVFLDRIFNCDNNSVPRENISQQKLFVLSNYGFYLFLLKISIHFTRIQEKVNRG